MTEQRSVPGAGDLLRILRDGRPRTRSELAAVTGMSRTTVTHRVDALLAGGLVGPSGEAAPAGGRPPTVFSFRPGSRVALGAALGATHVRLALTDMSARILAEERADLDIALGAEKVLDWVTERGLELLRGAGRDRGELLGMGIGLPGPVQHSTGRAVSPAIMPGWDGFDVSTRVRDRLGVPVLVDNDVNVMALGEHRTAWPSASHLMFVKAATGIGCGIVSEGRVYRGAQGAAGDMGHIRVSAAAGLPCRCGQTGCLEAVAGGTALAAALTARGVPASGVRDVADLARSGSAPALHALRQAGRDIGEVLAGAVNMFNPSVLVLGGALALAGDHLLAGVREMVYQRAVPLATERLGIARSSAGENAGAVGAAVMVVEHRLSPEHADSLVAGPP
ncbi:ROK family transcriptional regulator [Nocardiopsis algeriensis]|uniref:Putative NBD/HSP70 family sugar kinase n=1 Tax=Nocardiopsis algeriensis TaxID=1478215 RepID=A0A841IJ90_9ACTN|nr:putative NBD/HSP70 family sugar kinase [Nocardiopsis algeriensis]